MSEGRRRDRRRRMTAGGTVQTRHLVQMRMRGGGRRRMSEGIYD